MIVTENEGAGPHVLLPRFAAKKDRCRSSGQSGWDIGKLPTIVYLREIPL